MKRVGYYNYQDREQWHFYCGEAQGRLDAWELSFGFRRLLKRPDILGFEEKGEHYHGIDFTLIVAWGSGALLSVIFESRGYCRKVTLIPFIRIYFR